MNIGSGGSTQNDIIRWGGTALTGRDISADLENLDTTLSSRSSEATLAKLIPIAKESLFNTALPAANSNWFTSDITPTNSPTVFRIYVCVSVSGTLNVYRTVSSVSVTESLNGGKTLTANAAYIFDITVRAGDSINLRYSVTSGTILVCRIDELGGAA